MKQRAKKTKKDVQIPSRKPHFLFPLGFGVEIEGGKKTTNLQSKKKQTILNPQPVGEKTPPINHPILSMSKKFLFCSLSLSRSLLSG